MTSFSPLNFYTFAAARESARNAGGGSGLSNSSLTRSYNDSLGQFWILLNGKRRDSPGCP